MRETEWLRGGWVNSRQNQRCGRIELACVLYWIVKYNRHSTWWFQTIKKKEKKKYLLVKSIPFHQREICQRFIIQTAVFTDWSPRLKSSAFGSAVISTSDLKVIAIRCFCIRVWCVHNIHSMRQLCLRILF